MLPWRAWRQDEARAGAGGGGRSVEVMSDEMEGRVRSVLAAGAGEEGVDDEEADDDDEEEEEAVDAMEVLLAKLGRLG